MAEGGNVTVFGEIADKFDALVAYDEKLLDNWVASEGYSTSSMVIASTAMAFMTFAKGFVDMGRIGNGILVEGGVKGVGKDVLRALNVVGGAGALIGRGAKLLRMVQGTNLCSWFAHANAARLAGQRFFLTAEQLAHEAGISLSQIAQMGGTTGPQVYPLAMALKSLGIPVKVLSTGMHNVFKVVDLARQYPQSVITFAIKFPHGGGHALYATWSRLGGLIIRDPGSRIATYHSIAELMAKYGKNITLWPDCPILRIPNSALMNLADAAQKIGGGSLLSSLLVHVLPVITVSAADGETALQTLAVHERVATRREAERPGIEPIEGKVHVVAAGDWLSKIAKRYYGDMRKWPVIYAENARTIGRNPNLIKPGQRLFIPDLPHARIIAAAAVPGFARAVA